MFRDVLIIAALLVAWPIAAGAQCRTVCMPDETRDAAGCCTSIAREAPPDPTIGCAPGRVRSEQTGGECCWPGQVFGDGACRGIPSSCPTGYQPRGEACELVPCAAGQVRASDGITCCWPGQVAVGGQCRGVPSSCPPNFDVVGETCSDQRYRDLLAAQENERIARLRAEQARLAAEAQAQAAAAERRRTIGEARSAAFFDGAGGMFFGASLSLALPPVFDSFFYLAPRVLASFDFDPIEMLYSIGWAGQPDGRLSAFSLHAQVGLDVLSFPRADRSQLSWINLSVGPFADLWSGDGVPDGLTLFGGIFVAETMYLGCAFAVRVQYAQTMFGLHGPVSPTFDVSLLFGSRRADDPEGSCS